MKFVLQIKAIYFCEISLLSSFVENFSPLYKSSSFLESISFELMFETKLSITLSIDLEHPSAVPVASLHFYGKGGRKHGIENVCVCWGGGGSK